MDIGDVDVYSFVHLLYEKRNEIEETFSLTARLKAHMNLKFYIGFLSEKHRKISVSRCVEQKDQLNFMDSYKKSPLEKWQVEISCVIEFVTVF